MKQGEEYKKLKKINAIAQNLCNVTIQLHSFRSH